MPELSIIFPCILNHLYPQTAEKSVKIFEKLGYTINILENQGCCGYPYLINGEKSEVKELAQKLLFDFQTGKREHKITSLSPQCTYTIKNCYPYLFHNSVLHNLCQKVLTDVVDVFKIIASHNIVISPKSKQVLVIDNLSDLSVIKKITGFQSEDSWWLVKDFGYNCTGVGTGINKFNTPIARQSVLDYCNFAKEQNTDTLVFTDEFTLAFADSVIANEKLPLKTLHILDILYEQLFTPNN
ncbi:MAG: (Fe-S)-binding protein [Bacteroidetes bacterium]|nr:(Fe-S)-binding protein [Bacteroidota bacterium]